MTKRQRELVAKAQLLLSEGKHDACAETLRRIAGRKRKHSPPLGHNKNDPPMSDFDFIANFDGGCHESQMSDHGKIGVVITKPDGEIVREISATIHAKVVSCNVCEHTGAAVALETLIGIAKKGSVVLVQGDSKLVINQLARRWKVKKGFYVDAYQRGSKALQRLTDLGVRVVLRWIPRELNEAADALCA